MLAYGAVNFKLSLSLQLALLVSSSFGSSTTVGFRVFALGSPLWVEPALAHPLSIGSKTPSEPYPRSFAMWSPFGSGVVLGTSPIVTKDCLGFYSKFLQDGVTLLGLSFLKLDRD